MPNYLIKASEVVYYEAIVEADNEDHAGDIFAQMSSDPDLDLEVNRDGFQTDSIYKMEEDNV